jgi:hypothetical protein
MSVGPPVKYGERIATTCRLPIELRDRLQAEADRRCVGRNLIIERAIEEWLDRATLTSDPEVEQLLRIHGEGWGTGGPPPIPPPNPQTERKW